MTTRNRHERRLQKHLVELQRQAQGVMDVYICTTTSALMTPHLRDAVLEWMGQIPTHAPLCLTCDYQWTSLVNQGPPAAMSFLRPSAAMGPHHGTVSALCQTCAQHPDMKKRVETVLRKIWPNLRTVGQPQ
jgi:hypothetical protein